MRNVLLGVRKSLAVLVVLAVPLALSATASARDAAVGGPPVTPTPLVTSTTWSTVTPLATCGTCTGGGIAPACHTYDEYGSSYLNSGAEGISMHLWFGACHDGNGIITQIFGVGESCNAWGFINERNRYVNQDSGGIGQTYVRFHSHCEFSPSIGSLSTFWFGHDLYRTAYGTD